MTSAARRRGIRWRNRTLRCVWFGIAILLSAALWHAILTRILS